MTLETLELANHYERQAFFYAPRLFNCNGVPQGHALDPVSHREEVAYVANCLTIAAALRTQASNQEANRGCAKHD